MMREWEQERRRGGGEEGRRGGEEEREGGRERDREREREGGSEDERIRGWGRERENKKQQRREKEREMKKQRWEKEKEREGSIIHMLYNTIFQKEKGSVTWRLWPHGIGAKSKDVRMAATGCTLQHYDCKNAKPPHCDERMFKRQHAKVGDTQERGMIKTGIAYKCVCPHWCTSLRKLCLFSAGHCGSRKRTQLTQLRALAWRKWQTSEANEIGP